MPDIYIANPAKTSSNNQTKQSKPAKIQSLDKQNKQIKFKKPQKTAKQETVAERLKKERVEGAFKSYLVRPRQIKFETQEQKEKVVLLLRRHWLTNISWLIIALIMLLAPLILKYVPLLAFLPPRFKLITLISWYLIVTAFLFESFLAWYFNVNIITDERIIDVDFYSLGYKEVSEAKIDKVQDVGYITGGAIRSLFNYGDVLIQTAGEKPQLIFEAVPNPGRVAKILNELIIEEEQEKISGKVR